MRPVKLTIFGRFWDTQIYSGDLYLFSEDASLTRVMWRNLIDSLAEANPGLQTALRVGFIDGDLFYNEKVRKILRDPLIEDPIRNQLMVLGDTSLEISLNPSMVLEVDSPFQFVPTDTDVYYGTIIAAGDEGIFTCRTSQIYSPTKKVEARRHHDAAFLQVKSSGRTTSVAGAAGSDGLFEFPFDPKNRNEVLVAPRRLSPRSCKACDWSFESVLGWSEDSAFLARFKEEKHGRETVRLFDRVVDANEIFGAADVIETGGGYTWGAREKLYRLTESGISVVDLAHRQRRNARQKLHDDGPAAEFRGVIATAISRDEVVSTGTGPFGMVIELSDKIVVMRSDSGVDVFEGEPVHWRIFPRSDLYSNQLHVIFDDRIEIISFVHDYFVDQELKMSGFSRNASSFKKTLAHGSAEGFF